MATYTRNPSTVEAFKFGYESIPDWAFVPAIHLPLPDQEFNTYAIIDTSHGEVTVPQGNWIIMKDDGSFDSCCDTGFSQNYTAS